MDGNGPIPNFLQTWDFGMSSSYMSGYLNAENQNHESRRCCIKALFDVVIFHAQHLDLIFWT